MHSSVDTQTLSAAPFVRTVRSSREQDQLVHLRRRIKHVEAVSNTVLSASYYAPAAAVGQLSGPSLGAPPSHCHEDHRGDKARVTGTSSTDDKGLVEEDEDDDSEDEEDMGDTDNDEDDDFYDPIEDEDGVSQGGYSISSTVHSEDEEEVHAEHRQERCHGFLTQCSASIGSQPSSLLSPDNGHPASIGEATADSFGPSPEFDVGFATLTPAVKALRPHDTGKEEAKEAPTAPTTASPVAPGRVVSSQKKPQHPSSPARLLGPELAAAAEEEQQQLEVEVEEGTELVPPGGAEEPSSGLRATNSGNNAYQHDDGIEVAPLVVEEVVPVMLRDAGRPRAVGLLALRKRPRQPTIRKVAHADVGHLEDPKPLSTREWLVRWDSHPAAADSWVPEPELLHGQRDGAELLAQGLGRLLEGKEEEAGRLREQNHGLKLQANEAGEEARQAKRVAAEADREALRLKAEVLKAERTADEEATRAGILMAEKEVAERRAKELEARLGQLAVEGQKAASRAAEAMEEAA
mmetsp:Transcript_16700/g.46663  ORF Transcript_16700/g.46663 Transcript_16700/m.46663 type:complete len:520 (-) Transcript_16700:407-1966(-)